MAWNTAANAATAWSSACFKKPGGSGIPTSGPGRFRKAAKSACATFMQPTAPMAQALASKSAASFGGAKVNPFTSYSRFRATRPVSRHLP
jgi:hypothetical protein